MRPVARGRQVREKGADVLSQLAAQWNFQRDCRPPSPTLGARTAIPTTVAEVPPGKPATFTPRLRAARTFSHGEPI